MSKNKYTNATAIPTWLPTSDAQYLCIEFYSETFDHFFLDKLKCVEFVCYVSAVSNDYKNYSFEPDISQQL